MAETEIMEKFFSKKNQVFRILANPSDKVTKIFSDLSGFQREKEIVKLLANTELTTPCQLSVDDNALTIVYEYIDAVPVVDLIETVDLAKAKEIMEKICDWLVLFYKTIYKKTNKQYILGDIHLRNLLYEENEGMIYGVDFEDCRLGLLETDIARIYVFILHYDPAFTERKRELAKFIRENLTMRLNLDTEFLEEEICRETEELLERRDQKLGNGD